MRNPNTISYIHPSIPLGTTVPGVKTDLDRKIEEAHRYLRESNNIEYAKMHHPLRKVLR